MREFMNKIKSIKQLQKTSRELRNVYSWLKKNNPNLLYKYLPRQTRVWSKAAAKLECSKYLKPYDLIKNTPSCYNYILKNGFLDEFFPNRTKFNIYTKDKLHEIAKKYKTRSEFKKYNGTAYQTANKMKILNDICKHMIDGNKLKCKPLININTKQIFNSASDAALHYGIKMSSISSCCCGKQRSAGGYQFAYCDKNGNIVKEK